MEVIHVVRSGDVYIECVVPSCKGIVKATLSQIVKAGWRAIKNSDEHGPPQNRKRTHLGFCPSCARRLSVKDVYFKLESSGQ